ncbi:hypothetical protein CHCC14559_2883 [Bacillus licheniformis]|nr:hypothetical protein CHCC14566_3878 [Bacillus licheniformis]TWN26786.1 hypothetical protein CHCC14559_2883 [Bacillus licheniformis]
MSFSSVITRMKEGYISDFGTIHHHSITGNETKSIFMFGKNHIRRQSALHFGEKTLQWKLYTYEKGDIHMIHEKWQNNKTIKKVKCIHTDAKKYIVNRALTVGNIYEVKNETGEFLFIIDNTNKVGGYYKEYFEEVKA